MESPGITTDRTRRRLRRQFAELHRQPLNFDPRQLSAFTPENGWHIDDYRQPLPAEPPGPPVADGSWEIARRLVRDYAFADPAIIRHVIRSNGPEPGCDMLLDARFYGLRFGLGVRIGAVVDDTIVHDEREARVWGWNYRTLQGHLERGQMDHGVRKWIETGQVEFHLHAVSQGAPVANPFVRLGFALFGRYMQTRFHRRACRRMQVLTDTELAARARTQPGDVQP